MLVVIRTSRSEPQPIGIPGKWHLLLNSEFDSSELPAPWHAGWFGSGTTRAVNGLEDDCYSPGNVTFPGDNTMHLNVTLQPSTCGGVSRPYTGALVSTNPSDGRGPGFQYTYGVLQARVYLPADGTKLADWPAVWAAGQPGRTYGEDDVIEGLLGEACWHFHRFIGESGACDKSITPGWHTVASYWRKGAITFYYDGKKVGEIAHGITSRPMYVLLANTELGHMALPRSMRVQYVRVWQAT